MNIFDLLGSIFTEVGTPAPQPGVPSSPLLTSTPPPSSSKNLSDCHIKLREAYPLVVAEFEASHPGYTVKLDYTYRSPDLQLELYKKGRTFVNGQWIVTDKSQVVTDLLKGHHNVYPAQALD